MTYRACFCCLCYGAVTGFVILNRCRLGCNNSELLWRIAVGDWNEKLVTATIFICFISWFWEHHNLLSSFTSWVGKYLIFQNYSEQMDANSYYNPPHSDIVTETVSRREDYGDPREETEVIVDDNGVSKTVTVS